MKFCDHKIHVEHVKFFVMQNFIKKGTHYEYLWLHTSKQPRSK